MKLFGQNHRNTNLQTQKNKTVRNQITPKKITQTTPSPQKKERKKEKNNNNNNKEQINYQNPEKNTNGSKN